MGTICTITVAAYCLAAAFGLATSFRLVAKYGGSSTWRRLSTLDRVLAAVSAGFTVMYVLCLAATVFVLNANGHVR